MVDGLEQVRRLPPLSTLAGKTFDAVVIGGGVNGASAAQHLAAAGYSVAVFEKSDFATGSSSRSSRLIHCGLRHLAPGRSAWDWLRHPGRLYGALRTVRRSMAEREHLVTNFPDHARPIRFAYPLWKGGVYAPWHVDLAFSILKSVGSGAVPLNYRRLRPAEVAERPLLRWLRDQDRLTSVALFDEYQMDWPERMCLDTLLDAERLGAVVRNYTAVTALRRSGDETWRLELENALEPEPPSTVAAKVVLNMAGIWIDEVNRKNAAGAARRRIHGTKGIHIAIQLPPECQGQGIASLNRVNEPIYCIPWRGFHFIGPTETSYDGDIDDIKPEEPEIAWLIDEANHLLPGLGLRRRDVLYAWAGVRPLTHDAAYPKGFRYRTFHDFGGDGLPYILAMTGAGMAQQHDTGTVMCERVGRLLAPSGTPQTPSYRQRGFADEQNSPPLLSHETRVTLADLRCAAAREYPANLIDLLFRRVGVGWSRTMGVEAARTAAETVADLLGWDEDRVEREVAAYLEWTARMHKVAGIEDRRQRSSG